MCVKATKVSDLAYNWLIDFDLSAMPASYHRRYAVWDRSRELGSLSVRAARGDAAIGGAQPRCNHNGAAQSDALSWTSVSAARV
jgi:hypothetical protein